MIVNKTKILDIDKILLWIEFRYDGQIIFHIHVPSRSQYGEVTSQSTIIRTFSWTLLGFFQRNFDNNQIDNQRTFSLFLKCNQDKNVQNWSIFAKAELTLLHPTDPNKNFVKSKYHLSNIFHHLFLI